MRFEYLEPKTLEETISILKQHNGNAKVIAGGTDLINQIRLKRIKSKYVVDIGYVSGLDYIRYDSNGGLNIGALTNIRSLEKSGEIQQHHPVISQSAGLLGSTAIRNVATIGGNLCNAAPSAETAPSLIALEARVKLIGPEGERTIYLEDFFTGPGQTVMQRGELMVEIQLPPMPPYAKATYFKHSVRGTTDLAVVGVAANIDMDGERCEEIRLVLGAVAPTPIRAGKAEKLIKGQKLTDSLIERAAQAASDESRPITDVRASCDYRKEMVKVFTRHVIKEVSTRTA